MATITGRKVRWLDPLTGKRQTRTFPTETAATRFKLDRERDAELLRAGYLDCGELERQQRRALPIEPLLVEYLDELVNKRKRTARYVAECGRRVRRYLREQKADRLCDLETTSIKAFLDRNQRDGWGAVTVNAFRANILAFCRWLVDFKYLGENPVRLIRPMDPRDEESRRPSRALTPAECEDLLAATPCPTRRCLYLLRLRTGLRVEEAARLLWSDLDLGKAVLQMPGRRGGKLNTKNKLDAVLPLAPDLCGDLAELQRDAFRNGKPAQPEDRVFDGVVHADTFTRDLDAAGIEAEIGGETASPKALRKTFCSMLLAAGVDPVDTLLLMRHRPPAGLGLTLGVYADQMALLDRKRAAIGGLMTWLEEQRLGQGLKRQQA